MIDYPTAALLAGGLAAALVAMGGAALVGRAGFPLPRTSGRFGCVDGLRGYLALAVLVHHFVVWLQVTRLGAPWVPPTVNVFNQLGAGAVALFFMTSGLVFYPRVLAGFRATAWRALLIGRVFRILPLLALSVALVLTVIAFRTGLGPDAALPFALLQWLTAWGEPPLLGYADSGRVNAYVLWSLWYEWMFYLAVLPACAVAADVVRGRLPTWTVPTALLVGSLALQAVQRRSGPMVTVAPLFAVGMLAYEVRAREGIAQALRSRRAAVVAVAALALAAVAAPTPYRFALPAFALFFTCVACGNSLGGLLDSRAARVLGECSYGIYLLHGLALSLLFVDADGLLRGITTAQLSLLLPGVALAVALVTPLTYLAVERPAIRLGARLAARWSGAPARPPVSGFASVR